MRQYMYLLALQTWNTNLKFVVCWILYPQSGMIQGLNLNSKDMVISSIYYTALPITSLKFFTDGHYDFEFILFMCFWKSLHVKFTYFNYIS